MNTRYVCVAFLSLLVAGGMVDQVQAKKPAPAPHVLNFLATDNPGAWFECVPTGIASASTLGCVPEDAGLGTIGQKSLAVIAPGEAIGFPSLGGSTRTVHTAVSLIHPTGAVGMPVKIDIDLHNPESETPTVTLTTPGLYVFFCDIHVYMFAAVIVDDPSTTPAVLPLDLGESITLVNGIGPLPTSSDLATRLLRTFFVVTNPNNWQDYSLASPIPWTPIYPAVPVYTDLKDGNGDPISLDVPTVLQARYQGGMATVTLDDPFAPPTPGVGEVWVNTQFEETASKLKPGTATAIDTTSWNRIRKVALPGINLNHPHNMWTDRDQAVIYQTQWFDELVAVFNRTTGALVNTPLLTAPAPSHVMTRTTNDKVYVAQNGTDTVREYGPLGDGNPFLRDIPMGTVSAGKKGGDGKGKKQALPVDVNPHGHWLSDDGKYMVTPNENAHSSTVYNLENDTIEAIIPVGHTPIATGMMPDASKYYVANLLDSSLSVIDLTTKTEATRINLIANYDPVVGTISGPVGALPVQTPVSPDGKFVVTANTLTGTITVVDTATDTLVAMLGCDPGCHGVQWGAKDGGGYYAYVSSKFSNRMLVVDPDPNGAAAPNDGSNADVVGAILLTDQGVTTIKDDAVSAYPGMGGQGVLAVPNVYNGWVQQWVDNCTSAECIAWKADLTAAQKNPVAP